jgi:hypothetical protein
MACYLLIQAKKHMIDILVSQHSSKFVILPPAEVGGVAKSALPDVGIDIIREWYLSYIDLLQQMCLFTQAASLIRNCNDPIIGALNQQSTT